MCGGEKERDSRLSNLSELGNGGVVQETKEKLEAEKGQW